MDATWWAQVTPGTRYWRCDLPARHLPGTVRELTFGDLTVNNGHPSMPYQQGPCAVWQYAGNKARGTLMAWQQEQGIRVLMEVDDNYLIPFPGFKGVVKPWKDTDADRSLEDGVTVDDHTHEMHRRVAGWVDGIICSTENLAAHYRRVNRNVWVCPNSVDPDDWPSLSDRPDDGVLRIGWAASVSHHMDAHLVRRALVWASKQPGVEVWFLGQPPADWNFRFRRVPWTDDLAQYRASLQVLDVGLCALVDTPWSRGKSDVKALEYSMAGALSIVSTNVEPYRHWADLPCLQASSASEFEKAVRWCVFNRDRVKEIAAAAREYVLSSRTIGRSIGLWRDAVEGRGPEPYEGQIGVHEALLRAA